MNDCRNCNPNGVALRNLNNTTKKFNRWVSRWYGNLGSLECRECNDIIIDQRDVCLYYGKVMHIDCIMVARIKMIRRTDTIPMNERYNRA